MDQVEHLPTGEPPLQSRRAARRAAGIKRVAQWAPLWPLRMAAGALSLAAQARESRQPARRSGFAPADRTLAWASPAVLGASPQRRFYSGSNLDHAVTVEDLRAMAHRRLPRLCARISRRRRRGRGERSRATSLHSPNGAFSPVDGRCVAARRLDDAVRPKDDDSRRRSRRPGSTGCSGRMPICGSPRRRPKPAFRLRRARCRTTRCRGSPASRGCATGGSSTSSGRRRSARP